MTYDLKLLDGSMVLSLDGECTIEHASSLKEALQKAMHGEDRVVLNLEGVTAVDVSFLQLLCAAHRRFLELNRQMVVDCRRPAVLHETARAAGYYRKVGCHNDPAQDCLWRGDDSE